VETIKKPVAIQVALATREVNKTYYNTIYIPRMETSRSLHNHTPKCHQRIGEAVVKKFKAWRKKSLKKMAKRKRKEDREKEQARKKEAKEEKRRAKEAKKK
jgi:hypothetical protein